MEARKNVIDRFEIKKKMFEKIAEISREQGLSSIELIGMLEEIKTGVSIDLTIQQGTTPQEDMQ